MRNILCVFCVYLFVQIKSIGIVYMQHATQIEHHTYMNLGILLFQLLFTSYFSTDLPRTNNQAEGFNNAFNHMMGFQHPTIWKFLKIVISQQNLTKQKIAQLEVGADPPATGMKKKDIERNRRISKAVSEYTDKVYGEDDAEDPEDDEEQDEDSDESDDESATPQYGPMSQEERIEENHDWKLMSLIAHNSRLDSRST